jgi:hypothetical protein
MRNMEPLESRVLRSISLAADKTLYLLGTAGIDQFQVQMTDATHFEAREYVAGAWMPKSFLVSDVLKVSVALYESTDTLSTLGSPAGVQMFRLPMSVDAGPHDDIVSTGDGTDTVYGNDGNDTITVRDGHDLVYGYLAAWGAGPYQDYDVISGGSGRDTIWGGPVDDVIDAGGDMDTVWGGPGLDEIVGGDGNDKLFGEADHDDINDDVGKDTINGGTGNDELAGGADADYMIGGSGNDVMTGGAEDDFVSGGTDNDLLKGGGGDDIVWGGDGIDEVYGDDGNDELDGGVDADSIWGGTEDDEIVGGFGNDRVDGQAGNDTIDGGIGNDTLYGGDGDDLVRGEDDDDDLYGMVGNDDLYGGGGADELSGGDGLDGLVGGDDVDTLSGDSGADRFLDYFERPLLGRDWEDSYSDFTDADDAKIGFKDGTGTETIKGVDYGPMSWTADEIELADAALRVLHHAAGNDELLEQRHNDRLTFVRQAGPGTSGVFGWNGDHKIYIADRAFVSDASAYETLVHEIGHHWDDEWEWSDWKDLSGWRTTDPGDPAYSEGDGWWYLDTASFARTYGRDNPNEDFGTCFASYFANLSGLWSQSDARSDVEHAITDSEMATKKAYIDHLLSECQAGL